MREMEPNGGRFPKPKTLNPITPHATNDPNAPLQISHAPKSLKHYPSTKFVTLDLGNLIKFLSPQINANFNTQINSTIP